MKKIIHGAPDAIDNARITHKTKKYFFLYNLSLIQRTFTKKKTVPFQYRFVIDSK